MHACHVLARFCVGCAMCMLSSAYYSWHLFTKRRRLGCLMFQHCDVHVFWNFVLLIYLKEWQLKGCRSVRYLWMSFFNCICISINVSTPCDYTYRSMNIVTALCCLLKSSELNLAVRVTGVVKRRLEHCQNRYPSDVCSAAGRHRDKNASTTTNISDAGDWWRTNSLDARRASVRLNDCSNDSGSKELSKITAIELFIIFWWFINLWQKCTYFLCKWTPSIIRVKWEAL